MESDLAFFNHLRLLRLRSFAQDVSRSWRLRGRRPALRLRQGFFDIIAEPIRRRFRPDEMGLIPQWLDPAFARRINLPRRYRALWGLRATRLPRAEGLIDVTGAGSQGWKGELDQAASLHSVELRHPFHDARVVEFAFSIPLELFFDPALGSKPLLRRAMKGVLPEQVRTARRKVTIDAVINRGMKGFGVPVARKLLSKPSLETLGFVDAGKLRAAYETFQGDKNASVWGMWYPLAAEVWLNGLMEGTRQLGQKSA
jgi:asparagine synthetase B (glutamine-hydrolysing)